MLVEIRVNGMMVAKKVLTGEEIQTLERDKDVKCKIVK